MSTNESEIDWTPTRDQLLDTMGRPLTQTLFLELQYSEFAVYSLKEIDCFYKDKEFPSMKRLYLEMGDPTEYKFATKYLLGWKHWLRLCENKAIRKHIDEWRYELEVKLRSEGVGAAIAQARTGSWQAAKWLADKGWDNRGAGRPSAEDVEHEKKVRAAITEEYGDDVARLKLVK